MLNRTLSLTSLVTFFSKYILSMHFYGRARFSIRRASPSTSIVSTSFCPYSNLSRLLTRELWIPQIQRSPGNTPQKSHLDTSHNKGKIVLPKLICNNRELLPWLNWKHEIPAGDVYLRLKPRHNHRRPNPRDKFTGLCKTAKVSALNERDEHPSLTATYALPMLNGGLNGGNIPPAPSPKRVARQQASRPGTQWPGRPHQRAR